MTTNDTRAAELREQLEDIIPCINCAREADPADGFNYCSCGAEEQIGKIIALYEAATARQILEGQIGELENVDVWTSIAVVHAALLVGENAYLISHKCPKDDLRFSNSTIKDRIAELKSQLRAVGGE
jgi:hypothetical protein